MLTDTIRSMSDDATTGQATGEQPPLDLTAAERRLAEVEAALERLEENSYGRCSSCGRPIDDADLELEPQRSLCARCSTGGG